MTKLEQIKNDVDQFFKLDIAQKTNRRDWVYARAVYYYIAKEVTGKPLHHIGNLLSKDHCSVINGLNLHKNKNLYKEHYNFIEEYLYGPKKPKEPTEIQQRCIDMIMELRDKEVIELIDTRLKPFYLSKTKIRTIEVIDPIEVHEPEKVAL